MEPKTLDYSPELFAAIMEHMTDYYQLGETVCGAEDPAVIEVSDSLGKAYPEFAGLPVVRVTDTYVSAWVSDTHLEFSARAITATEYAQYTDMAND